MQCNPMKVDEFGNGSYEHGTNEEPNEHGGGSLGHRTSDDVWLCCHENA